MLIATLLASRARLPRARGAFGVVLLAAATVVLGCAGGSSPSRRPAESSPPEASYGSANPGAWEPVAVPETLDGAHLERVLRLERGFLAVGCLLAPGGGEGGSECAAPAAWFSTDAISWSPRIDLPILGGEDTGVALAATDGAWGIVIGGRVDRGGEGDAAAWFARDGLEFERATFDVSARNATIVAMRTLDGRPIAVGSGAFMEAAGFRAWSSADGAAWTAAQVPPPTESYPIGVVADVGRLVAWGPSCGACLPSTHWWTTEDGTRWTGDERAPGLEDVIVTALGTTDAGFVAAGGTFDEQGQPHPGMWHLSESEDVWRPATAPVLPPVFSIDRLLQVGHGTVAGVRVQANDGSTDTLIVGQSGGPDGWVGLAELRNFALVDVVQDPVQLERLVVVGHTGDGNGPVETWMGRAPWAP